MSILFPKGISQEASFYCQELIMGLHPGHRILRLTQPFASIRKFCDLFVARLGQVTAEECVIHADEFGIPAGCVINLAQGLWDTRCKGRDFAMVCSGNPTVIHIAAGTNKQSEAMGVDLRKIDMKVVKAQGKDCLAERQVFYRNNTLILYQSRLGLLSLGDKSNINDVILERVKHVYHSGKSGDDFKSKFHVATRPCVNIWHYGTKGFTAVQRAVQDLAKMLQSQEQSQHPNFHALYALGQSSNLVPVAIYQVIKYSQILHRDFGCSHMDLCLQRDRLHQKQKEEDPIIIQVPTLHPTVQLSLPPMKWCYRDQEAYAQKGAGVERRCAMETCGRWSTQRCIKCKQVWYCSAKCQKEHWPDHKRECKKADAVTSTVPPEEVKEGASGGGGRTDCGDQDGKEKADQLQDQQPREYQQQADTNDKDKETNKTKKKESPMRSTAAPRFIRVPVPDPE